MLMQIASLVNSIFFDIRDKIFDSINIHLILILLPYTYSKNPLQNHHHAKSDNLDKRVSTLLIVPSKALHLDSDTRYLSLSLVCTTLREYQVYNRENHWLHHIKLHLHQSFYLPILEALIIYRTYVL